MTSRTDLEGQIRLAKALALRESGIGLRPYLGHVVINSSPSPKRFAQVADLWQWDLFRPIDQALEYVAGLRPDYQGPRSFWLTMPRGHDKTSSIGRRLNWLLSFSPRRLSMSTAAADSDQAGLIKDSMESEANLNPWLKDRLKFGTKRVYGQGGNLAILTADAPSTFGRNDDIVIIDELTHWKKRDLWDVLISGRHKRPGSVFIIITNAGVKGTWQSDLWSVVKSSPLSWYTYSVPERESLASWLDRLQVEEQRRLMPPGLAKRVFDNIWVDPGDESGYLSRAEVMACEALSLDLGWVSPSKGLDSTDYYVGVDYGPKRDRTVLAVLHHHHDGTIRVDRVYMLQGSPGSPVPIVTVERLIEELNRDFHSPTLVIDPYQMEGTVQRYEYHQTVERFEPRGGKSNYEMAATLRSLVVNKRLIWYPGAGDLVLPTGQIETLADELSGLVVRPTVYGYRFDHEVRFHDDRAVAIGMAALLAARSPPSPVWIPPPTLPKVERPFLPEQWSGSGAKGLWGLE